MSENHLANADLLFDSCTSVPGLCCGGQRLIPTHCEPRGRNLAALVSSRANGAPGWGQGAGISGLPSSSW